MKIVFIGAGRLATHLAPALRCAGHDVCQVYSRTMASAKALADSVGAEAVDDVEQVTTSGDVYIMAVADAALTQLVQQLASGREQKVFIHTAGSMPLSVFEGKMVHGGVLYPMQTFSKERQLDFATIPVFIEATDDVAMQVVETLANAVSRRVMPLDSQRRKSLHLAAVFACNFTNHCYELASEVLKEQGLPFDLLLPLIAETADKVKTLTPHEAQTGPAVRFDRNVISNHLNMLEDKQMMKDVYELLSESIFILHQKTVPRND